MKIYRNSLKEHILEYMLKIHSIPRKELRRAFEEYEYTNYSEKVKELIQDGYIEDFRYKGLINLKITSKGIDFLRENDEEIYSTEKVRKKVLQETATPKSRKRRSMENTVILLCKANGVLTDSSEKPKLINVFTSSSDQLSYSEKKLFAEKISKGIFYTTSEIREVEQAMYNNHEIGNWSKLIGIIFKDTTVKFIYNINDSLNYWNAISEKRTVKGILELLTQSSFINEYIEIYDYPDCIICGKGYSMIPKIIYGRKKGKKDVNKATDRYQTLIAAEQTTVENFSKVFAHAYYVSDLRRGTKEFKDAIDITVEKKKEICNKWFRSRNNVIRSNTLRYNQGVSQKQERIAYMPILDLIELRFLKDQGEKVHLVVPEGTQESVSRVMGPLVLSIRDLTGEKKKYNNYDKNGTLLKTGEGNVL